MMFRVRFPVAAWEWSRPKTVERPAAAGRATPAVRRSRLLVVDDEPTIGAVLKRTLGAAHDVEVTTDPVDAIARIERGDPFDLILCDLVMPVRSGMDVHAAVLRRSPELAKRMIFLTGGPGSARAEEFIADPARVVLDKPFTLESLVEHVTAALAGIPGREREP